MLKLKNYSKNTNMNLFYFVLFCKFVNVKIKNFLILINGIVTSRISDAMKLKKKKYWKEREENFISNQNLIFPHRPSL